MRFERFANKVIDMLMKLTGWRNGRIEAILRHHGDTDFEQHYRRMLFVFDLEGHSGATAALASRRIYRLMNCKPLSPVTKADYPTFFKNNHCVICSGLIKTADGGYVDMYRTIFREPDGSTFGAALPDGLRKYERIKLPYYPNVGPKYIMEVNDKDEIVAIVERGKVRKELERPVKL